MTKYSNFNDMGRAINERRADERAAGRDGRVAHGRAASSAVTGTAGASARSRRR